jgi:hypothetical protein
MPTEYPLVTPTVLYEQNLNEPELVRLCYEVSIAMQYLANNNYTHGNLKARNCL